MTTEQVDIGGATIEISHPVLNLISDAISSNKGDDPADILDLFEIVHRELALKQLNQLLYHLVDNPEDRRRPASKRGIVLATRPNFMIAISIIEDRPTHLYWHPRHKWHCVLKGGAAVTTYHVPDAFELDVVDRDAQIVKGTTQEFRRGETFVRNGMKQVVDIASIENDPLVLLVLYQLKRGGIEWMFSRENLRRLGGTAVDPNDSHLISLIHAASQLGDQASISSLKEATMHSQHFVRWAAVQAIGQLDRDAALDALAIALDDPHPEIRDKARTILERTQDDRRLQGGSHGAHD